MSDQKVWQIACGETGRKYDDLFRQHDLMFLGPGRFGRYCTASYDSGLAREYFTGQKIGQVRSFVNDVNPHDIVLLRSGYRVLAVGLVADEGYDHNETFDDVYGWDLQHTRRVIWQDSLENI